MLCSVTHCLYSVCEDSIGSQLLNAKIHIRFFFLRLKFKTERTEVNSKEIVNIGESFFECIGVALRQPAEYLEKFLRNTTKHDNMPPELEPLGFNFLKSALGERRGPIQEVCDVHSSIRYTKQGYFKILS